MVSPVKLDTVKAWKNVQGLYDSIGKASTTARLDELSEKRDFVAESLEGIFPERSLAISVSRQLRNRLNSRRKAIRLKPGRQPKPDLWKAESKSPEPFPFPEEGLVVKGAPPNPKKKSDQIRELTGLITESLRAWSGNP